MLRTLRPVPSALSRALRQQAPSQQRFFVAPTALRADFVQDLYLRELKAYKPTPVKPSDAEGHVMKFAPPAAPKSPEEGNIANELKAYEDQEVEIEGQAVAAPGETPAEQDWFEDDVEEEHATSSH